MDHCGESGNEDGEKRSPLRESGTRTKTGQTLPAPAPRGCLGDESNVGMLVLYSCEAPSG